MGRRRGGRRVLRERVGVGLFALTLSVPALMFGGQHTPVLLLAALLAAASAWLLARRVERLPTSAWLILALLGFTALQLLPLPVGLVRWLSPSGAEVWSGVLRPFGEASPGWIPLTVDPSATALELLKGAIYACIAVAAAGLLPAYGGTLVSVLLFGASLLVALVTLTHGLLDAERVYGLYVPPNTERWTHGPFVNGNNLGGFLNIGLFAGAGLWLSERGRIPRWLPALGIPLLAVAVVLAGSRGGVAALAVGAVLFVVLAYQLRGQSTVALAGGVVLVGIAGVIGLFAAAGGERVRTQLLDTDTFTKLTLWRWSSRLVADFPVFGVGRGGFETAFPPYRGASEHEWSSAFAHAENFVIDWAAEWGVPVTLAALLASGLMLRRALRRVRRDPHLLGLAVGLAVLLLQNLVDLGLEIFSIAAAAVAAFATACHRESSGRTQPAWLVRLPIACTLIAALLVIALGANNVQVERRRLASVFANIGQATPELVTKGKKELRSAMLHHPGESYFPLLGSFLARREHKDPLPWLARALERAPRSGPVHLALADVLRARGKTAQSLMHLRLAARYDFYSRDAALARASSWAASISELARAFPEGSEGGSLFRNLCPLLHDPGRLDCLREAVRRDARDLESTDRLAERLLELLEAKLAPCAAPQDACASEAERLVGVLSHAAKDWRGTYLRARLRAVRGDVRGAAVSLLEECPASEEAERCVSRALAYAEQAGEHELLTRAGERYLALSCAQPARCAEAHGRIARSFAVQGSWGGALRHYSAGAGVDPSPSRWLDVAEAATQAGSLTTARTALRRASNVGELTPEDHRRKSEIETKLRDPESP